MNNLSSKVESDCKRRFKPQHVPLALVVWLGIGLSALLFISARGREGARIQADFERAADNRADALRRHLDQYVLELETIAAFHAASQEVTRQEFREFVRPILARHQSGPTLAWVRRVPDAERAAYEEAARIDGHAPFEITELNAQGKPVRATPRTEYFPIHLAETSGNSSEALGFDLASNPTLLRALNDSCDTGQAVATGLMALPWKTGDRSSVLIFLPAYRKRAATDSVEARGQNLIAFAAAVLGIGDVVTEAMAHLAPEGVDVHVFDTSAPRDSRLLYFHSSRRRTTPAALTHDATDLHAGLHHATTLAVGGRRWLVVCRPTPEFLAAKRTWQPWVFLAGGPLLTGFLIAYILLVLGRAARTRRFAAEQVTARHELEIEIRERTQAEAELKAASQAVEEANRLMNGILSSVSSIVIAVDENDRITQWNPAAERTFGVAAREALRRPLAESAIAWDNGEFLETIAACRDADAPFDLENVRFTRPNGTVGLLAISVNPIKDEQGVYAGLVLLGADVTERTIVEEQLSQAQKLESVGALAAGIAHEINTPIQFVGDNTRFLFESFEQLQQVLHAYEGLKQAVEAVEAGGVAPAVLDRLAQVEKDSDVAYLKDEIPKAIGQTLEGVERVATIVRAMKDFSHPNGGQKALADVNRALENTLTVAHNELKYVADVVTDLDPDLPPVPCYLGDLNQVFLNLLVNAAHAIAEAAGETGGGKGTITISTRREGREAVIRIADTGAGIPEAVRDRVFEPFFTTKQVGKGTGQGLAIAHNAVVEKHGGTLTFDTNVGTGTTFTIRLPL